MARDGFFVSAQQHVAAAERSTPSVAAKHVTPRVLRLSCALHTLQATGDIRKVAARFIQTTEMYLRAFPSFSRRITYR